MKKYKTIFSSFHTVYRLITVSTDIRNFSAGVCRICKNIFYADKVAMICKNVNSYAFIKIKFDKDKEQIRKGGISILNQQEKDILSQGKEVIADNRLVYPFNFVDTLGVIYIKRGLKKGSFSELDKRWFLSLCEEVSIGLKIFYLYREEKKIMISYIKSLTKLLDTHIPTSYLHTKNIFRLIRVLGKELRLSDAEIRALEYASLLHDAGKIQLPYKILKKPAPLTDEEFKIIMKHPHEGVEMIKDLNILKPTIPIILHHHERYDGKGYPSKLKKGQIPLGSRILAVIDSFDAMYFGRPYKKRKDLKAVEEELKAHRGKQFDPRVVDAFLKIIKRKKVKKYLHSFL